MIAMIVVDGGIPMMLKVKEAEKKTEKDRALVKEGCGHIRSEDLIIKIKIRLRQRKRQGKRQKQNRQLHRIMFIKIYFWNKFIKVKIEAKTKSEADVKSKHRQQLNSLEAKQRRAGKSGQATRDQMLAVMKNQAVIIRMLCSDDDSRTKGQFIPSFNNSEERLNSSERNIARDYEC